MVIRDGCVSSFDWISETVVVGKELECNAARTTGGVDGKAEYEEVVVVDSNDSDSVDLSCVGKCRV